MERTRDWAADWADGLDDIVLTESEFSASLPPKHRTAAVADLYRSYAAEMRGRVERVKAALTAERRSGGGGGRPDSALRKRIMDFVHELDTMRVPVAGDLPLYKTPKRRRHKEATSSQ